MTAVAAALVFKRCFATETISSVSTIASWPALSSQLTGSMARVTALFLITLYLFPAQLFSFRFRNSILSSPARANEARHTGIDEHLRYLEQHLDDWTEDGYFDDSMPKYDRYWIKNSYDSIGGSTRVDDGIARFDDGIARVDDDKRNKRKNTAHSIEASVLADTLNYVNRQLASDPRDVNRQLASDPRDVNRQLANDPRDVNRQLASDPRDVNRQLANSPQIGRAHV